MVALTAEPPEGAPPPDEPTPPVGEWWSDEPPMETYQHLMQMLALIATLRWLWRDRSDYFAAGNLTVFYSPRQMKSEHFRGPDFFVVLDVDGTRERRSWVVWEEDGRYPNVIVELLSDATAKTDRGEKKRIYQDIFRTPEYFLFDPRDGTLEGLRLLAGRYEPIAPDAHGLLPSAQLGLCLGVRDRRLRLFTADGAMVLAPDEAARESMRRAEEEQRRAELEAQRADGEKQRADGEKQRADGEKQRADDEKRRADAAEAELARLRAQRA
jgi:Uma2 family endonuclease